MTILRIFLIFIESHPYWNCSALNCWTHAYLIFPTTVFRNIFRFGKYFGSYSPNAYGNAYRPLCEVSVIFVRFKTKLEWVDKLYKKPQYQISWKSVERFSSNLMLTDRRTDVANYLTGISLFAGFLPQSHGFSLTLEQPMWDLWWTKCNEGRFLSA
jgi:hypothetical protein